MVQVLNLDCRTLNSTASLGVQDFFLGIVINQTQMIVVPEANGTLNGNTWHSGTVDYPQNPSLFRGPWSVAAIKSVTDLAFVQLITFSSNFKSW